jgi:hypothetical protein
MTVNLTDSLGRRFGLCSDYGYLNFYKEGRQAGTWVLFEESRSPDSIMYLAMAGYSFDHKEKGSLIFFNPNGVVSCMLVKILLDLKKISPVKHRFLIKAMVTNFMKMAGLKPRVG